MKEKGLILCFLIVSGLIAGGLYFTRSTVLLYEFIEQDSVSGLPLWALLHPLRDRSPERFAEPILQALQEGRVEEVLSRFPWSDADRKSDIMAEEAIHPIQSWKLISRVDSPGRVELYYSVRRRKKPGSKVLFSAPMWITLERSVSDAAWKNVSLRVYY